MYIKPWSTRSKALCQCRVETNIDALINNMEETLRGSTLLAPPQSEASSCNKNTVKKHGEMRNTEIIVKRKK